jgi:RNA polymerase sigma factor (sigma-70 family)
MPSHLPTLENVRDTFSHPDDFYFALECLEGKSSSITHFQQTYSPKVLKFLRKSGASDRETQEIVDDLWTDCVSPTATRGPKLMRYDGSCSLQTWLNTVALNNYISLKRREERRRRLMPRSLDDSGPDGEGSGSVSVGETWDEEPEMEPLLAIMKTAIDAAFQECDAEDFVLLQLRHCDQLKGKELGVMFQCDTATISRRVKLAQKKINDATLSHIKKTDSWLDLKWKDFVEMCRFASPGSFED